MSQPPGPPNRQPERAAALGPLRQLEVRFHPEEDRLMLRASTQKHAEIRCWLTRRMVKLLWPPLMDALGRRAIAEIPVPTEAREQVAAFRRETALEKADFSKPFAEEPQATLPLGETPVLVSRASVRATQKGLVLQLLPKTGEGLTLALEEQHLHSLCELIRRAVTAGEWNLDLPVPAWPASDAARSSRH
jgi:hypothetical protein